MLCAKAVSFSKGVWQEKMVAVAPTNKIPNLFLLIVVEAGRYIIDKQRYYCKLKKYKTTSDTIFRITTGRTLTNCLCYYIAICRKCKLTNLKTQNSIINRLDRKVCLSCQ